MVVDVTSGPAPGRHAEAGRGRWTSAAWTQDPRATQVGVVKEHPESITSFVTGDTLVCLWECERNTPDLPWEA